MHNFTAFTIGFVKFMRSYAYFCRIMHNSEDLSVIMHNSHEPYSKYCIAMHKIHTYTQLRIILQHLL